MHETQLQCSPARRTAEEDDAFRRWLTYEVETERFDRAHCAAVSPRDGETAIPLTPREHQSCSDFARDAHFRLELDRLDPEGSRRARDEVQRLTFAAQVRYLAEFGEI